MMMTGETINILLTQLDADRFVVFQKHYEALTSIIDSGALDTKNGKVILSFNHQGRLMDIEVQKKLFHVGN